MAVFTHDSQVNLKRPKDWRDLSVPGSNYSSGVMTNKWPLIPTPALCAAVGITALCSSYMWLFLTREGKYMVRTKCQTPKSLHLIYWAGGWRGAAPYVRELWGYQGLDPSLLLGQMAPVSSSFSPFGLL